MEFKTEALDEVNFTVDATISAEEISSKVNEVAQNLSKTASIPGFRKGKVPVRAVKQQYGSKLTEDAEQQLLRQLLEDSTKDSNINLEKDLVSDPDILKYDKQENGDLNVSFSFSTAPKIEITEDLDSLIPELETAIEIADADIDSRINEMVSQQAPFVPVTDRAIQSGDQIKLDFEGFVDGVAFEGGKAENYSLKIGSGSFIPGFEDQLIGMNIGDEKDINVTFPENYNAENLAGKESTFRVKINAIEAKAEGEITDEVVKKLVTDSSIENPTLDDLKKQVKDSLYAEQLNQKYQEELKDKLIANLLEKHSFALPKTIVSREIENVSRVPMSELSEEEQKATLEDPEKRNAFIESLKPEAETRVKTTYLIDALAKKENLTVSDEELQQILYYEAIMNQQDPTQLMDMYKQQGYLPLIKMSILEDKVLRTILDRKHKTA